MKLKKVHPLLIRGEQLTEKPAIWRLKDHPHTTVGRRRSFEVRIYHYPAKDWPPYLVTLIADEGFMIEAIHSPNAAAAQATALEMLGGLSCGADHPSSTSEAAAVKQAYADRVDHITGALIAAIDAAGATYPQAKHALARAFGALIGANSETDSARAAAVSTASRTIAGCAENATPVARHGRTFRSPGSRLN